MSIGAGMNCVLDAMNILANPARRFGGIVPLPSGRAQWGLGLSSLAYATLALLPSVAAARPLNATQTQPTAEAIIRGDHAEYVVRFDGPVNHLASRLEITQDGRVVQILRPLGNSAVDVLFSGGAVPSPGRYMLRWTAVSGDGDTSTGYVPFSVE